MQGATPTDQKRFPEGAEQIFAMSRGISDNLKEDLAWATYVLLRNTNSISVVCSIPLTISPFHIEFRKMTCDIYQI